MTNFYLSPLIEDLKLMWDQSVEVFDEFTNETIKMNAMLFCTINDFLTYGNLWRYNVKDHKGCPICEEDTTSPQLKHGRKTIYLRHRRFLKIHHPYQRLKKAFNGHQETGSPPTPLTSVEVYEKINNIDHTFGKSKWNSSVTNIWKKKSIFFNLPYWSRLEVKYCIDVMHVEKNVCDSLIGTLLTLMGRRMMV